MKFLINTHHTKGPCAGLFNYVIGIIQLFYYLIKPFCVLATTNFSTFRIYYMEKWQEDFTAIFYRTAGSSFQMHSQYPFKLILYDKTFSLNFNHSYFIYNCYYWLPILWVVKNLNNATTNLHFQKKKNGNKNNKKHFQ